MNEEQQVQQVLAAVPPPQDIDPTEPPHVLLHVHENPRSVALVVLCTLAVLAVLKWASAFFIPLMLGFVFYYALSPVVEAMARVRIPRAVGAAVLITAILAGGAVAMYSLVDDANELIDSLPAAAQRVRDRIEQRTSKRTPLDQVQRAAAELEKATESANTTMPAPGAPRGVQRVVVEKSRFDIREHLWTGGIGLATVVGQVTLVTFLTYFLLMSGDTFRRKLVKITGPSLTEKKLTVQALDEINVQIQRYLLVQLLASVGVGIASGVAFGMLGLKHAAVWGVVAGILNLVPYVGSILITLAAGFAAFVQSGDIELPMWVVGVSLLIHTVEGNLLVPWLTSKASRMNAVSVFIGVLFWGWLWGVWGLLLGIPIMMVIKAVCDRVEQLKPVGELLGT
ncbi:AI-2E family transporter [Ramlibacter humi]|uniref:AI-2E family transporter n=1 Tax=Ramlibacter humi TaxID=2530451 RepID=A0A4Z0BXG6_9BURK|nr:AI-2E family transporter [Ramlibacter humi]TFZ04027.1 AI-2E family transporter [Ramlibacter humi]